MPSRPRDSQGSPATRSSGARPLRLAQHGRVAPVNIAQRVIYAETAGTGQGVTETGDTKAAHELAAIWGYVKELLQ